MYDNFTLIQAHYPWAAPVIAFVFGSAIGSFLNVVVYRLPIMLSRDWQQQALEVLDETTDQQALVQQLRNAVPVHSDPFNLVVPNSRCPLCNAAIKPWHNIPILGYLLVGGKCASCDAAISVRYPVVETATALATMITIFVFGATGAGLAACVLTWALIALALIDYDTQLLPDDITLPLLWIGLTINFFGLMTSFTDAFLGACLGYLVLWIVFQVFKLITGKEGMGYGDFKMLAMLGAWLGFQQVPLIIVLSSFSGAVIGGALILLGRDRAKPIKFGPFLAIAGWISLLWGDVIINTYLSLTIQ
jgi:leader peptidase (prepilin peptidase)/N-methyltransferase